ncbi:MAG: fibronectin type III domain-containing protein [Anaerolineae bacterium]
MKGRKLLNIVVLLVLVLPVILGGASLADTQGRGPGIDNGPPDYAEKAARTREKMERVVSQAERQAVADRAADAGLTVQTMEAAAAAAPGDAPRYFSHPNYANSPVPAPAVTVQVTGDGTGAEAEAIMIGPAGEVLAIVVTASGSGYLTTTTTIGILDGAGTATVPAVAEAIIDTDGLITGTPGAIVGINVTDPGMGYSVAADTGMRKFVDPLPWGPTGAPMPVATSTNLGDGADYYEIGLVQFRQQMHSDLPATLIRGYVQLADCTDPGAVPLFNENVDPLVPAQDTGYCGVTEPSYMAPAIVAQRDTPVRILFRNLLPVGEGGNLFIPTDTSVMGSGMGPDLHGMPEINPQTPTCDSSWSTPDQPKPDGCFTENRAVIHLHGGLSPWISDGTPHQWITPADETLPYPDAELLADPNAEDHDNAMDNKGVSVEYVPDMWFDAAGIAIAECFGQLTCAVDGATNNPGKGAQTYYFTNQQSARLLFYHDHSWGITRLNVYAGEAAPYLIQDDAEHTLTAAGGALEGLGIGIPLVIQDKTFVPSPAQLSISDETWDSTLWGGEGNMWLPHVYSPAQNPGDPSGVNQFGRWAYGPWFWPPTNDIAYGPIANPYYDPTCDPDVQWCEPPLMPGTPFNSMGMEAFHDTPVINGVAYPTVTLDPGEHRFRILNAASDRFFNLSLYQADPLAPTEVQLNPDEVAAALADPTIFPTPLAGTEGPAWIQIGTEGGFLPAPVVLPAQPTTWVNDPTVFNAGNVDQHSLLVGPAERADVVIDLSPFAGQTLILYNDAPAAFPARDPRYDYYTGNGDYRDTGGAPSTLPGYGPNIRTVMQIKVTGTPGTPIPNYVNETRLAALEAAFGHQPDGSGVFESSQHPIIVGQGEYNSAYGTNFQTNGPLNGTVQIFDTSLTFNTLPQPGTTELGTLTMAFMPKQIQDEMGEAFDRDYGRMSGFLGLESPNPQAGVQNMILYPYVNPASELIDMTNLPWADVDVAPIATATDGSQIWKITHNGVDTHPIHFHLFDVQVINRVGWDGIIRKPDPNELGWKDTVRISPLEDTIVALRPLRPSVPFDLPNSSRPLNPAMPTGSSLMFTNMDAWGDPTVPIVNEWTNFGWEYVWHCHILSHEEMDMMRPISVAAPPDAPSDLTGTRTGNGRNRTDNLTWVDNSGNETGFIVQRALNATGPWEDLATVAANVTSYSYVIGNVDTVYIYRVIASNTVGYSSTAGYSTMTVTSISNAISVPDLTPQPPTAPTDLTAEAQTGPQVLLTWTDNATTESGFVIERAISGDAFATLVTVGPRNNTGTVSYIDVSVEAGISYDYRVRAVNAAGFSAYSNTATVAIPSTPAAPSNVVATTFRQGNNARVTLTWVDNASNETGYRIQRATNATFTANLVSSTTGADATSFTTGNLSRNTPYYFRVQSYNGMGPSEWVNATPFPITTAP